MGSSKCFEDANIFSYLLKELKVKVIFVKNNPYSTLKIQQKHLIFTSLSDTLKHY